MKAIIAEKYGTPDFLRLTEADLEFLTDLLDSGKIVPVIDRTYSLSEVPNALRYLGEGHACGKMVISISGQ